MNRLPPPAIPLHRVSHGSRELAHVQAAIASGRLGGNGEYTRRCEQFLAQATGAAQVLLTSSCTHALEMAALLLDIQPGDEVICPSFTFVSTANAFVLRGARMVFVDVVPGTMCIDVEAVRAAIGPRTVAIVPVHYAGACCDMDALMALAGEHALWVVEDAAQAALSRFRGRALGTIGHLGAFSFHATKNFTAGGEGGALLVNDPRHTARAEILREKGTDRGRFLRGEVARYQWQDAGSSYLVSELQAAFLLAQLEQAEAILAARRATWAGYHAAFAALERDGSLARPGYDTGIAHNAHGYFLRIPGAGRRDALRMHCLAQGVEAAPHFPPLHASPAGLRFGEFRGTDRHTTPGSDTLLRLPLWAGMADAQVSAVIAAVRGFLAG